MKNLKGKHISISPKENLELAAMKSLENSEEDFLDMTLQLTPKHSLTGKVDYHGDDDQADIALDELNISITVDLDFFNVEII
jgi:hypothetical protein